MVALSKKSERRFTKKLLKKCIKRMKSTPKRGSVTIEGIEYYLIIPTEGK